MMIIDQERQLMTFVVYVLEMEPNVWAVTESHMESISMTLAVNISFFC
jgi:hypothetical protein